MGNRAKEEQFINKVEAVADVYIRSITKYSTYSKEGNEKNYIYPSENARGRFDDRMFKKFLNLEKIEIHLFSKCVINLKYSDNSIRGFCVKFIHSEFKELCSSRTTFGSARDKLVKEKLLIPIKGFKQWFIVNPYYVYKGQPKHPARDYKHNILDWNHNPALTNHNDKKKIK